MAEQTVEGVFSAEVDAERRRIVPKGILGAQTSAGPSRPVNTLWKASGRGSIIGQREKTLTERFNEAYDEDARREDEEFFRATRAYYRRRSNNEE